MGKAFEAFADWLAGREAVGDKLPAVAAQAEKETILVIDDEPDFLDAVGVCLRDAGYNVLAASSGTKGLNMMRYAVSDIHVVLLDYRMPQLNGEQTLKHLRRLSPQTKVIAVTGVPPEEIPKGFREGTDYFIRKPFPMQELLSAVKAATVGMALMPQAAQTAVSPS
jgi:DNA-binding response OmpR family regulator